MPIQISTPTTRTNEQNKLEPMLVQTAVLLFAIVVTAYAINSLMSGGMSFAETITGIDPQAVNLISP